MNKNAEYYQGRDVTVKFDIFEDGKPTRVGNTSVEVYDSDNFILNDVAETSGSEVRYTLKGDKVQKTGKWSFVFDVLIRGIGNKTHVVDVDVKKLPVPTKRGSK